MYDVVIIGAGVSGTIFASKISKHANTLLKKSSISFNNTQFKIKKIGCYT
jgi:flavin-dependent dehydrogenase